MARTKTVIGVAVSHDLANALKAAAKAKDRTVSNFCERLLKVAFSLYIASPSSTEKGEENLQQLTALLDRLTHREEGRVLRSSESAKQKRKRGA